MNCISVCDGISAASVAAKGLDFNFLLLSEIESFPRSVLKYRHGAVDQRHYNSDPLASGRPVLWGDFTALRPRHIRRFFGDISIDALFGGTPCQSYSVAGKRAGLDDPRGELSLEYALLAFRLGVRWFLWENVPGVFSSSEGKDFAAILSAFTGREVQVPRDGWQSSGIIEQASDGHFGIAWRVFDAQYAGVPQRRRRVFVVGHLGDWRRAAAVLFDEYSMQGHPAPRREKRQDVAPTISSRPSGGGGLGTDFDLDGGLIAGTMSSSGSRSRGAGSDTAILVPDWPAEVAPTLDSHYGDKMGLEDQHIRGGQVYSSTGDVAHCLNAGGMGRQDFETETLISVGGFPDPANFNAVAAPLTGNAYADRASEESNLIAFTCKDSGADASDIAPTLRSMGHDGSHANAGGQVAIAIPIADMATRHAGTDGSGGEAGKGHGLGIGGPEDPMFTLTKGDKHSVAFTLHGSDKTNSIATRTEVAGSVRTKAPGSIENSSTTIAMTGMAVRRLTPRECERLQGFPDDYTLVPHRGKPAADEPRYKALGNSWAVPCARWILERMQEVDSL